MISFETVRPDDAALLFKFVNAPDSLKWKLRTTKPVSWNKHVTWLDSRLKDPGCTMWIIVADGVKAGQIRLEKVSSAVEVDIYVTRELRKKNIASYALSYAADYARSQWPGISLTAHVKINNDASLRLFLKAGFRIDGKTKCAIKLELPLKI